MALPKVPDTIQRHGKYHAKIRVPKPIQKHWGGKAVYQQSLKTSDPKTAEKEVRRIRAIMDAELDQAKAEESRKALSRNLPPDQRALLDDAGGLSGLIEEFYSGKRALAFLRASEPPAAVSVDFDEGPIGQPVPVIVDQAINAELLQAERAAHDAFVSIVRTQNNARGRVLRKFGKDVELDGDVFSLRDVLEEWATTVDAQTADAAKHYVRRFTELHGEIPVTELTKAHLRDFAKAIQGLPAITSAKLSDDCYVRDLPFQEAVDWAQSQSKDTLSDKTRDKYVAILKGLLGFAASQDYRSGNPWADYKMPRAKRKHSEKTTQKRRPFTPEEVRRILDHVASTNEPKFGVTTIDHWGPWISAHHGTRLQETCQLRLCDFEEQNGVWSMRITDEGEGMRAKSDATVRWVPVHPRLIEKGLKAHIEERRQSRPPEALAFNQWARNREQLEELKPDSRGRVSGAYGKRFTQLREKKLKITGGKVSFHSFRHRLQDAADEAGIPDAHRRYLTGRANKDAVEGGYGQGAAMPYLLKSLQLVDPMKEPNH